ncbi:MAG TPA: hypothetical protein DCX03_00735 [Bacteroidales bacterium]|nr:hypothetical protein [Bacteroidales bacterium]
MLFWIIIVTILLFLILFLDSKYISLVWVLLGIISAFRYNVGTDYVSYEEMFNGVATNTLPAVWISKEKGFLWLLEFVHMLGGNFQAICLITTVMIMCFSYYGFKFILKDKPDYLPLLTLLYISGFYFFSLNAIRQSIAVSIFIFSVRYIYEQKPVKYFMLVLMAFFFHKSAIILFPLYWFLNIRLSRIAIVGLVAISIGLLAFNPFDTLKNMFSVYDLMYSRYFSDDTLSVSTTMLGRAISIASSIGFLFVGALLDRNDRIQNIIFNSVIIFIILRLVSLDLSVMNRLAVYFKPMIIVFILLIIMSLINNVKDIKLVTVFLLIVLSFSYSNYVSYIRANRDGSYNHYTINLCITGRACPVEVYGDYKDLYYKGEQ